MPRRLWMLVLLFFRATRAWTLPPTAPGQCSQFTTARIPRLCAPRLCAKRQEDKGGTATTQEAWQDEDAGAGVVGAQFFGGNKEKEIFYDAAAELEAGNLVETGTTTFNRFADRTAFDTPQAAQLAVRYQQVLNAVIQGEEEKESSSLFAPEMQWESPLPAQSSSLLDTLRAATQFYRRLDVAVVAAQTVSDQTFQLQWEIGVAWPTFWEPAVLLTGTSLVTVTDPLQVQRQVDTLDDHNNNLLGAVLRQWIPRFWDTYHIGMTPTAEISPIRRISKQGGWFQNYELYEVPARWMWMPSVVDKGDRDDANAAFLPTTAFTAAAIRTMGPQKDAYIPTTPTQIAIAPASDGGNRITWGIPLTVELQSQTEWPLSNPQRDGTEERMTSNNTTDSTTGGTYVYCPSRRVAAVSTGLARPQDEGVAAVRQALYGAVTAAGGTPKMEGGRPSFFFWSAATKTCYTAAGLGMAVYEWRPAWAKSNYIGLELDETPALPTTDMKP